MKLKGKNTKIHHILKKSKKIILNNVIFIDNYWLCIFSINNARNIWIIEFSRSYWIVNAIFRTRINICNENALYLWKIYFEHKISVINDK